MPPSNRPTPAPHPAPRPPRSRLRTRLRRALGVAATGAALAALALVAGPGSPAVARPGAAPVVPGCSLLDGVTHCYVATAQQGLTQGLFLKAHGAGAHIYVDPLDDVQSPNYSIAQFQIEQTTLIGIQTKVIEFGWVVAPGSFGQDHRPHPFLAMRRTGGYTCLLGAPPPKGGTTCPFTAVAGAEAQFGQPLSGAGTRFFHLGYYRGDWWIQYQGHWMGHVPASWFGPGGFPSGNRITWQGEVGIEAGTGCVPMGDGIPASEPASAAFSGMFYETIVNQTSVARPATADTPHADNSAYWSYGQVTGANKHVTGFHFGGPGRC